METIATTILLAIAVRFVAAVASARQRAAFASAGTTQIYFAWCFRRSKGFS